MLWRKSGSGWEKMSALAVRVKEGFPLCYVRLIKEGGRTTLVVVIDFLGKEEKPELQFSYLFPFQIIYGGLGTT